MHCGSAGVCTCSACCLPLYTVLLCTVISSCICVCIQVDAEAVRKLRPVDAVSVSQQKKLSEMDIQAVLNNDSTYLKVGSH